MQSLSKADLKTLMAEQGQRCISIYLPTHRLGAEIRQGPIQLRNMLREAANRLLADGLAAHEAKALLDPVQALLRDVFVWRHLGEGLALFLSPRLFRGTHYDLSEVRLEHVPRQLAEVIQPIAPEKMLQFHTAAPVSRGHWASVYYAGGAGAANVKPRLLQHCHEVEQGVHDRLRDAEAPLVLAGVDYLLALYREVNRYPYLEDREIVGSPERLRLQDLRAQAWAIVQPHVQRKLIEAVAQYRQLAAGPRTSAHLRAIVPAACQGRVGVLFVAEGHQQWGTFDPAASLLQLHPDRELGDEDLLDLAAVHTLLAGGTVYAIPPDQMPTEAPLAAVFRY